MDETLHNVWSALLIIALFDSSFDTLNESNVMSARILSLVTF
jgi:hypothetical protein